MRSTLAQSLSMRTSPGADLSSRSSATHAEPCPLTIQPNSSSRGSDRPTSVIEQLAGGIAAHAFGGATARDPPERSSLLVRRTRKTHWVAQEPTRFYSKIGEGAAEPQAFAAPPSADAPPWPWG